ncbi:hypothetical protein Q7C_299 [Methylophaga frappieri]|uniref:MxaK protein n=2 Tax=Methylophaga frappieri (strain ATCC BAA-2434 / DSM 25690 / JAM7) TaxID=754477 RepID=I1YEY5_METFJ|nr:hypothetical protein Q7C_299 [Methylophaga frappieri]
MLIFVIIASVVWLISTAALGWQQEQLNRYIADPSLHEATPDNPRAYSAKAAQLVKDMETEKALENLTLALGFSNYQALPEVYYNRGNINLRKALSMSSADGRLLPLIELAKQDYRSALQLNADLWEARYNLEVALRIVPEDPDLESDFEKNEISSQRSIESKAFKIDLP